MEPRRLWVAAAWWVLGLLAWQLSSPLPQEYVPSLRSRAARCMAYEYQRLGAYRSADIHPSSPRQPQWHAQSGTEGGVPPIRSCSAPIDVGVLLAGHEGSSTSRAGQVRERHGKAANRFGSGDAAARGCEGGARPSGGPCWPCSRKTSPRQQGGPSFRCLVLGGTRQRCPCCFTARHGCYRRRSFDTSGKSHWTACAHNGTSAGVERATASTLIGRRRLYDGNGRFGRKPVKTGSTGFEPDTRCFRPRRHAAGGAWPLCWLCHQRPIFAFAWTGSLAATPYVCLTSCQTRPLRKNGGGRSTSRRPCCCQCLGRNFGSHPCGNTLQQRDSTQYGFSQEHRSNKVSSAHFHSRRRRVGCTTRPWRPRSHGWSLIEIPMQGKGPQSASRLWRPVIVCCLRLMGLWRLDNTPYLLRPGFGKGSGNFFLCIENRHCTGECLGDVVHSVLSFPIPRLAQYQATPSISSHPAALYTQTPWSLVVCVRYSRLPALGRPGLWVCTNGWVSNPLFFGPLSCTMALDDRRSKAPNKRIGGSGSLACYLSEQVLFGSPAQTRGCIYIQRAPVPCRPQVGAFTHDYFGDRAPLFRSRFFSHTSRVFLAGAVCYPALHPESRSCDIHNFLCQTPPFFFVPSRHGVDEAPNKRIGGSGSLARLLPYPSWFHAMSFKQACLFTCDATPVVAFFHTLLILTFILVWQLLLSATPFRKSLLGRLLSLPTAKPPAQVLLPLGSVCRPGTPILSMCPLHSVRRINPARPLSWSTSMCCLVLISCPRLIWAVPPGIPGPSEGFGPHFVGPSLAERLDQILPEPFPRPDPPASDVVGSAMSSDSFERFREVAAEVREASLREACEQVVHTLQRAESSLSGTEGHNVPGTSAGIDEGGDDFEDLSVDLVDARDQHTQVPGVTKLLPVLLAAPGYPLETVWVGTTLPATVGQLCSDVKEAGPGLFAEIGDTLTPTHPQLEIGLATFVVTPPWFPEANLAAILIDARAVQGTVFAAVLSYPTCLEEIRRAAGFQSVPAHAVFAAGDNDPLPPGRPLPLQNGVLVKLLPPNRVPFWAPPLAFALWHPYMWPAGASIPPQGYGLRALLLHHSGKYILDNFDDDDWANLNSAARLIGIPLAELSVEPASQDELYPYVYHGSRIRCVLAVTPKQPPQNTSGQPMSYVLFVDSRPVGFDVNFLCLDQGHIRCDQLLQHLQQPPPPGWRLVVRGGQKRDQGYDFVHGEVLTLALARLHVACEENPESEEGFSPDDEEPFDDSSSERRARTRTRSRTPGRGPHPRADPDVSSDHSYQGFDSKVKEAVAVLDHCPPQIRLGDLLTHLHRSGNLVPVPCVCYRTPSYTAHRVALSGRAGDDNRVTLPTLRDIADRSPERPQGPAFEVDPPLVLPAQPLILLRGLFVVLAERYKPEVIPLDLRMPVDIASAREAIQEVRLPLCKHRFPYLIPVPYQPCSQFAIFLAAPAWTKNEIEVAFDCSGIGGMLHSKCVPMLLSFQQLCDAAGVAPWLPVEVWVEPFREPVQPHRSLRLYAGSLVIFRNAGAGCPELQHLMDMLRSATGWDQLADLPFSFDPAVWILADDGPFRFLIEPEQGGLGRQAVAQALDCDPARLTLVPPEPPIRDLSHIGLCASAVLIVSRDLPNLRGPRFGPCAVFLDLRPLLADLSWMVCPDGLFHLSAFVATIPRRCPPGFKVVVWGAFPVPGTDQYRVADGTKLTFTYELIPPNPQHTGLDEDTSDSGSEAPASSRHTMMSDSSSADSDDFDDSPSRLPAGPPPPRPPHRTTYAGKHLLACFALHSFLIVQPAAATHVLHPQVPIASVLGYVVAVDLWLRALVVSYAALWLPFWSSALCGHVCRLLCDLASGCPRSNEAYQALRAANRLLAIPWPLAPLYAFEPEVQDADEDDDPMQPIMMNISCVILKPEYVPERVNISLHMPCTLGEIMDALQASRSTPDFVRFPHLLHANPQPIRGLAVFVALPRWHPTATVICLNTAAIDGRIFATYAPDRLNVADLCWLADLPTQVNYVVYVAGDDQPLPPDLQVHIASGDHVVFLESEDIPLTDLALPAMLLRLDLWRRPGRFPDPRVREAYCLALRDHQILHIEDFSRPFRFKSRLAHSAGLTPDRFHVLHADPAIHNIALFGVPCRALLAACTCGRGEQECLGIFFDLRPIQEGVRFVCRSSTSFDLAPITEAFDAGAPIGWRTQLQAYGQTTEETPEVWSGITFIADYVPCVGPGGQPVFARAEYDTGLSPIEADAEETPQDNNAPTGFQITSHPSSEAEGVQSGGAIEPPAAQGSTGRSPSSQNFEDGGGNAGGASNDHPGLHQPASTTGASGSQPLPFLIFSVEYKPEGIFPGLAPPLNQSAAIAVIAQLRAPSDHRRTPRLLPANPQPPHMPAVLLALPYWPTESVTILFDCHVTARRTFAEAVPRFFSRSDVLTMANIDPSTPCHVFHRDVPWPIPEGYWIYPTEGDWIGIFPEGDQPGPLPTLRQYLYGDVPTTRARGDLWDSDIAWVLSDGPQVAVPIPEDSFAINSSQAAAALGLHPGRFILVPAAPELADHAHRGQPSRRVLLAKQTDDSDEDGGRESERVPYILDLRPVQLYLCQAAAPEGMVDVAEICQRLMIRCPRGFHVRLYGGTFADDVGNHTRRVQAGDIISVEYHPDYVREVVSQLEPGTYSPGTSITDSQGSAQGTHQESTSSAYSGSADAGTGGSATVNRGSTRQHSTHHRLGTRRCSVSRSEYGHVGMWSYTFSSLCAILDGTVRPTPACKANTVREFTLVRSCRLRDHPVVPYTAASRPFLVESHHRSPPEARPRPGLTHLSALTLVAFCMMLFARICHHTAFADVLIPALLLVLSRHRGLGFCSMMILMSLGTPGVVLGVQLPRIDVADAGVVPAEIDTRGVHSDFRTSIISVPGPSGLHVPPVRPLPTPCRAGSPLPLPAYDDSGGMLDNPFDQKLCTLLEESCRNQEGYPFYLAATLVDALCAHFAPPSANRPVICLQELVPPCEGLHPPTASRTQGPRGRVPVRPLPLPFEPDSTAHCAEVTLGSTPLGFSLRSLAHLLRSPANVMDYADLCQVCPAASSICWLDAFQDFRHLVPAHGLVVYTDGSFTPEHDSPAKAGWAAIFLDPHQETLSAAFGPVITFPMDTTVLSPYVAECYALMAAALISTVAYHDRPIAFLSDCVAAVGVSAGKMTFQLGGIAQAAASAHHLRRQLCCRGDVYHHVPGHCGFAGNEMADRASKAGANQDTLSCGLNIDQSGLRFWLSHGAVKLPWVAMVVRSLWGDPGLPPINEADLGDNRNHAHLNATELIQPFVPEGAFTEVCARPTQESTMPTEDTHDGVRARHFALRAVTFNVLSLGKPKDARPDVEVTLGLAYQPARAALLAEQLLGHNIHVAFLHETRADPGSTKVGQYLRYASGAERGQFGTEIWVREHHAVIGPSAKSKAGVCFDKASFVTVHSDARRLFLRFSSSQLSLLLVALHSPHRATEKSIISSWWHETSCLLHTHCRQSCLLIGGDLNASLGGVTSAHVGGVAAEDEDLPGGWVHDIARRFGLFLPATFADCHSGQSYTYTQKNGGHHCRPDFLLLPTAWASGQITSWCEPAIQAGHSTPDHVAACAAIHFRSLWSPAEVKLSKRKIRVADVCAPENQTAISDVFRNVPCVPWQVSVHAHAAIITKHVQDGLQRVAGSQAARPHHAYLSDATWQLQRAVSKLRRQFHQLSHRLHSCDIAASFCAWARGVPLRVIFFRGCRWQAQAERAKHAMQLELHTQCTLLRKACRRDRDAYISQLAETISTAPSKDAFAAYHAILAHRRKKVCSPDPLPQVLDAQGAICPDAPSMRRRWREHFAALEGGQDTTFQTIALQAAHGTPSPQPTHPPTIFDVPSLPDLCRVLAATKVGKATGMDSIPAEVNRAFTQEVAEVLFPILLKMLWRGAEPAGYKGGQAIIMYKGRGQTSACTSYRSILLMNTWAKTLHQSVRPIVRDVFEQTAPALQLGGRSGCSVTFGSHILRGTFRCAHRDNTPAFVLFADISAAFYSALVQLVAHSPSTTSPQGLRTALQGLTLPDEVVEELRAHLQEPSALSQSSTSSWLEHLAAHIGERNWFVIAGDSVPIATGRGTRPGSSWADVLFALLMPKVLRRRDALLESMGATPVLGWRTSFDSLCR